MRPSNNLPRRPQPTTTEPAFRRVQSKQTRHVAFSPHKDRIEKMYSHEKRPLNYIMDYMKKEFGINLSVKQYKSQLKSWGLRHKLTKRDAAFILRLLNQAKSDHRDEVVIFSGHPRRREDITKYIQRNEKVAGEDDLLSCITNDDKTPDYIRLQDFPVGPQQPPPSHLPPTPPSASSFGSLESHASSRPVSPMKVLIPSPESSPRHSGEFSDDLNFTVALSGPIHAREVVPLDLSIVREHASMQQTVWTRSQPAFPNILGPFWRAQREPIPSGWCQLWDTNDPSKQWPADFTDAVLSSTPAEIGNLEIDIYRFGDNTHSRQLNDESLSARFVMYCLYWLICAGQNDPRIHSNTNYYWTNARFMFLCMLANESSPVTECLGALSIVSVLFDCYGQGDRLSELLTTCDELTRAHCGLDNPLTMTIEFKKNMLQRGGAGCPPHDIARLSQIVTQMKINFSESSAPALTARYNLAWAMLENELKKELRSPENFEPARRELLDLTRQWEQYGDDRIETIMAAATLARATFYCGDADEAEDIIAKFVMPRVRKNFPEQHAYSWEAKHRHAFFLFQLANKETGANVNRHLLHGEQILREVVRNRRRILGASNPKSTQSFRLLRDILKAQGRIPEADTLSEWCERQQSSYRTH